MLSPDYYINHHHHTQQHCIIMDNSKQSTTPNTGWFSRFRGRRHSSDNLSSEQGNDTNQQEHIIFPRRSSAPIEWTTPPNNITTGGKLTNRQSTIPSLVESSDRHGGGGSSARTDHTNPLDVSDLHLFESITSCTHDIVEREWNRRCYDQEKEVELMNGKDDIDQSSKDQQEESSYEVRELLKFKQKHEEQWGKDNDEKKNEEEEEDMIHTSWIMNECGGVRSYQYRVQRSMSSEHLNDKDIDADNINDNAVDDSLRSDYTWQTYNEPESCATVHIICSDTDTDGSYKDESSTTNSNTKEEEGEEDYTSKSSLDILRADLASATDLVNNPTEETKLDISEMIQLKLLIANQQATIDTLSTQLHNLRSSDSKASRMHALEIENDILSKQLAACQESNFDLRKKINNYQRRATLEVSNKEDDKVLNENISEIRNEISKLQTNRTSSGSSSSKGSMMKKQGSTRRTGVRRGSIQRSNVTAPTVVMSEESDRSDDVLQF